MDDTLEERRDSGSPASADRWSMWDRRIRDGILFLVGIGLTINEFVIQPDVRIETLPFLAGLLGLPFALRADERRHRR